jgi:hypothetical protein
MAKLTPAQAIHHLHYIERQREAGRLTPQLEGIEEHRLAFLLRSKCCVRCGRKIENPDSLKRWELDHLGPECRTYVMTEDESPESMRDDLFDREAS